MNRRVSVNADITMHPGAAFSQKDIRQLSKAQDAHRRQLRSLRAAVASGNFKLVKKARMRLHEDFAARLIAIVRATSGTKQPITFATLEGWAHNLSLGEAYHETLIVRPEPTGPGTWRAISLSGVRRKAQQLLLRDLLLMQVGDNEFDSTVPGAGGEVRLFEDIKRAIAEGYHYWVSIDIRNFFPSLRPGHLAGFPLSKWIIGNLVFLPPETPIKLIDRRYGVELCEATILNGNEHDLPDHYPYTMEMIGSKVKQVRQGLIQGDVCAPQIARTVLGRELQQVLGNWEVVYGSHLDDVLIGARSRSELKTSIQALTSRLTSLPAGPLDLHEYQIRDVRESVYFLGYRVSLRKDGSVYVRPGKERFDRFRERLRERLKNCTATTKEGLLKEANIYAKNWFRAHPAWDKSAPSGEMPFSGESWDFLQAEVAECVNRLIHQEYVAGGILWTEEDIDFDLITY